MKYFKCYPALIVLLFANSVYGQEGNPNAGKGKYASCGACHGVQGQGGIGPALAGQPREDLINKLRSYKAGETIGAQSALMWGQAAMLSEGDISDVVEYILTLSNKDV